jgi:hypothetical protein
MDGRDLARVVEQQRSALEDARLTALRRQLAGAETRMQEAQDTALALRMQLEEATHGEHSSPYYHYEKYSNMHHRDEHDTLWRQLPGCGGCRRRHPWGAGIGGGDEVEGEHDDDDEAPRGADDGAGESRTGLRFVHQRQPRQWVLGQLRPRLGVSDGPTATPPALSSPPPPPYEEFALAPAVTCPSANQWVSCACELQQRRQRNGDGIEDGLRRRQQQQQHQQHQQQQQQLDPHFGTSSHRRRVRFADAPETGGGDGTGVLTSTKAAAAAAAAGGGSRGEGGRYVEKRGRKRREVIGLWRKPGDRSTL